jgi:cytochrome c oxidase subunit 5b
VKPSNEDVKLSEEMPGFRAPGAVATDYEIASGLERYELLKTLKGEDPWTDLHPINITALGTPKKPIIVTGIDPERYIGCTGKFDLI